MYANFYCTHSLGPIIHMTGLRPVKVTGYEGRKNERHLRVGCKCGSFGMEMVELENGGLIKSLHGGLYKNSIWYSVYGSKGRMESAREDDESSNRYKKLYVNVDEYDGEYVKRPVVAYEPQPFASIGSSKTAGHGGSDFYSMYHFVDKILGNPDADVIDVYEAMDMGLCGLFAYRSVLAGGVPMTIPNLRNKEERDAYRNDTACTDPKAAGDMLLPAFSQGNPDIPVKVYDRMRNMYLKEFESDTGYVHDAFQHNNEKKPREKDAEEKIPWRTKK